MNAGKIRIRTVLSGTPFDLEKQVNATIDAIDSASGSVVVDVNVHPVPWELCFMAVIRYWTNEDDEARDIAESMAEDQESDRQAEEQMAADIAAGVFNDFGGDEVQDIDSIPF